MVVGLNGGGEMKAGLPNAIIEMGSIVFGISRVL